tara:strand:+ start:14872 stop:16986 length:2115 start_codon:yes stop_codon:yes gene_type:complete
MPDTKISALPAATTLDGADKLALAQTLSTTASTNGATLAEVKSFANEDVVVGPSSSTDNFIPQWDGATGKLLKEGVELKSENLIDFSSNIPAADQVLKYIGGLWTATDLNGSVTQIDSGTGLSGGPITTTGTLSLANTTVSPGDYTSANITVDAQGRLTAAANGSIAPSDDRILVKASGGDFTTVNDALSGKTGLVLIFVDGRDAAVTETSNISIPNGAQADIFYVGEWVIGANNYFAFNSNANGFLRLHSTGGENDYMTISHTTEDDGMLQGQISTDFVMQNCYIKNESTKDDGGYFNPNGKSPVIKNVTIELPNYVHGGFDFGAVDLNFPSSETNITYVGGGINCGAAHICSQGEKITNILFDGFENGFARPESDVDAITNRQALIWTDPANPQSYDIIGLNVVPRNLTPADYIAGTTYSIGRQVIDVSIRYESLQNSNTGNTPASSPAFWKVAEVLNYSICLGGSLKNASIGAGDNLKIYGMLDNVAIENVDFGSSVGVSFRGGIYRQYVNGDNITITNSYNLAAMDTVPSGNKGWNVQNVRFSQGSIPTFEIDEAVISDCAFNSVFTLDGANCTIKNCITDNPIQNAGTDTIFQDIFRTDIDEVMYASTYQVVTNAATTFTAKYGVLLDCDATSGNQTVSLPTAVSRKGDGLIIRRSDSGFNNLTVDPDAAETINGDTTKILFQYDSLRIVSDGANWIVI